MSGIGEVPLAVVILNAIFAFAHSATGLVALLIEVDPSFRFLLDVGPFTESEELSGWPKFLRGFKRTGRGTAPNIRAWGVRQTAIGVGLWYGAFAGNWGAALCAIIVMGARVGGDIIQNILDGCFWKVGIFVFVEGVVALIVGLALAKII